MKGIVTLVVGPSGVGKSSYYQQFYEGLALEKRPRVFRWTTRDPRLDDRKNSKNYTLESAIEDASELIDVNGNFVSLKEVLEIRDNECIFRSYFGGSFVTDEYYEQHKEELVAHHDYQKSKYGFNLEEIIEHLDKGEHVLEQFVQYEHVDELSNALTERGYKVEKVLMLDDLLSIKKKLIARSGEKVFKERKELNIDNIRKYLQNLDDFDDVIFHEVHEIKGKEEIKEYIDGLIISIENDEEIKLEYDFNGLHLIEKLHSYWKGLDKKAILEFLNDIKYKKHSSNLRRSYPLIELSEKEKKRYVKRSNVNICYMIYNKIFNLFTLCDDVGLKDKSEQIISEMYSAIKDIGNHKQPKGIIGNHIYKILYSYLIDNLDSIPNKKEMIDVILSDASYMDDVNSFLNEVFPNKKYDLKKVLPHILDIFIINNPVGMGTFNVGFSQLVNLTAMNMDYLFRKVRSKNKPILHYHQKYNFLDCYSRKSKWFDYQNVIKNINKPWNINSETKDEFLSGGFLSPVELLTQRGLSLEELLVQLKGFDDYYIPERSENCYLDTMRSMHSLLTKYSLILFGENMGDYNIITDIFVPSLYGLINDMGDYSMVFNKPDELKSEMFLDELKPFFAYQNHYYLKNLNRVLFSNPNKSKSMDNPLRYPFVESPAQLVNDYWIDEFRPLEDYVDEYLGDLFKLNKFLGEYVKKHEKLQKPYEKFKEALDKFVDEC